MLLAILLSAPVLVTLPPSTAPLGPICRNFRMTVAAGTANAPRIEPLDDQPPGQHILAVMRTDFDGCVKPVAVRSTHNR